MNEHRFFLQKYNGQATRYTCPSCGSRKTFVPYIDGETNEPINIDLCGRCNRLDNCGYHLPPREYFALHPDTMPTTTPQRVELPPSLIPDTIYKDSLQCYSQNNLYNFLCTKFSKDVVNHYFSLYKVGTSKHWSGATVFWQLTQDFKCRAGKIMLYNAVTGRRVKEPYSHITWAHSALGLKDFNLRQCLFGSHLVEPNNIAQEVGLVESEKTALICAICYPGITWLATGGSENLTPTACQILENKRVLVIADIGSTNKWRAKIQAVDNKGNRLFSPLIQFNLHEDLERNATDADKGKDIADFLI